MSQSPSSRRRLAAMREEMIERESAPRPEIPSHEDALAQADARRADLMAHTGEREHRAHYERRPASADGLDRHDDRRTAIMREMQAEAERRERRKLDAMYEAGRREDLERDRNR